MSIEFFYIYHCCIHDYVDNIFNEKVQQNHKLKHY